MKINNNYPLNIKNVYQKQQQNVSKEKKAKESSESKDKIQLSPEAQKIKELVNKVEELPEIREEKVKEIKDKIESGNYFVSAYKLAEKMLADN